LLDKISAFKRRNFHFPHDSSRS